MYVYLCLYIQLKCCHFRGRYVMFVLFIFWPAKSRNIAISPELEMQLMTLFAKLTNVQKHAKMWSAMGKSRIDSSMQNPDYRIIVEGLQVRNIKHIPGSRCISSLYSCKDLLTPLSEDAEIAGLAPWMTRILAKLVPQDALVVDDSNRVEHMYKCCMPFKLLHVYRFVQHNVFCMWGTEMGVVNQLNFV